MADGKGPVNKSGRPVNSTTSSFSDVIQTLRDKNKPGAAESRFALQHAKAQSLLDNPPQRWLADPGVHASEAHRTINFQVDMEEKLAIEREQRGLQYSQEYSRQIGGYSGTRASMGRIRSAKEYESSQYARGMGLSNQRSWSELESQRIQSAADVERFRNRLSRQSEDPNTDLRKLQSTVSRLGTAESELARSEYGMERMRVNRQDPGSIYDRALKRGRKLNVEEEFAFGASGGVSREKADANLTAAKANWKEAMAEWTKALKSGATDVSEFAKKVDEADKAISTAENVADGAGGG